ncbi:MAG: hypothetical protein ACRYFX_30375 [Janthinobacterium lividum]
MYPSLSRFQHFLRLALVALPLLLLLSLNGRAVSLLRPVELPAQPRVSAPLRATVVKQKVLLEAAAPLGAYLAAAAVLGWLPATLPSAWAPRLVRRAVAAAPLATGASFVATWCRQRVLRVALSPQAP